MRRWIKVEKQNEKRVRKVSNVALKKFILWTLKRRKLSAKYNKRSKFVSLVRNSGGKWVNRECNGVETKRDSAKERYCNKYEAAVRNVESQKTNQSVTRRKEMNAVVHLNSLIMTNVERRFFLSLHVSFFLTHITNAIKFLGRIYWKETISRKCECIWNVLESRHEKVAGKKSTSVCWREKDVL